MIPAGIKTQKKMFAHCLIRSVSVLLPLPPLQGPHPGPCHPTPRALHAVKVVGVHVSIHLTLRSAYHLGATRAACSRLTALSDSSELCPRQAHAP